MRSMEDRRKIEEYVYSCMLQTPEEVARLYKEYTLLIWDYKMVGAISQFYDESTVIHRIGEHNDRQGVAETIAATMSELAAYPDLVTNFVEIFAEGNAEDGYYFAQVTYDEGTNTGFSEDGPPTGHRLTERGPCLSFCQCRVQKCDGRWKIAEEWLVRDSSAKEMPSTVSNVVAKREDSVNSNAFFDHYRAVEQHIAENPLQTNDDIRAYYCDVMELIYNCRMVGWARNFYSESVDYTEDGQVHYTTAAQIEAALLQFIAPFPDLKMEIEHCIVAPYERGYKLSGRLRFRGSNTAYSRYGAPTGKSLGDGCMCLHVLYLGHTDAGWKVVRQICSNGVAWINSILKP